MAPMRLGDGASLRAKGYSQVRKGDGTELWNAIPDSVVEDFEDGNLDNYSGDKTSQTIISTDALEGSFSLETTAGSLVESSSETVILWTDHPDPPQKGGDDFSALIEPRAADANGAFLFATSGSTPDWSGYVILLGTSNDATWIGKVESGSSTWIAQGSGPISQDQTYEVVASWQSNDTISATTYEFDTSTMTRGSEVESISATDGTFTTGGIGLGGSGDAEPVALDWYVIGPGDGNY